MHILISLFLVIKKKYNKVYKSLNIVRIGLTLLSYSLPPLIAAHFLLEASLTLYTLFLNEYAKN